MKLPSRQENSSCVETFFKKYQNTRIWVSHLVETVLSHRFRSWTIWRNGGESSMGGSAFGDCTVGWLFSLWMNMTYFVMMHWTRWASVEISPECNSRDGQPHLLGFDTGCDFQEGRLNQIGSREGKPSRPCQRKPNQNTLTPQGHHLRCNQCHPVGIHRQSCFSLRKLQLPKEQ